MSWSILSSGSYWLPMVKLESLFQELWKWNPNQVHCSRRTSHLILCEELKLKIVKILRLYDLFFNPRPLEATLATSNLLDPHIWYSNALPWSQDVEFDLGLRWPRAASNNLRSSKLRPRSGHPEVRARHLSIIYWGSRRFEVARVTSSGLGLKKRSYSLKIFWGGYYF